MIKAVLFDFDGTLIDGKGITTQKLENMGVKVISEEEVPELLKQMEEK